jgi:hypothetical protein
MKRTALLILLLGLLVIELLFLEVFIPYGWHHPLSETLDPFFPAQPYEPHPRMDLEIEEILRQHASLRIALYLFTGALAAGNAFLIFKAWKALRGSKSPSPQT